MVTNLADLRNRVLRAGGKIVPGRFEFSISPVQLKDDNLVPLIWNQEVHGIRYAGLADALEHRPEHRRMLLRPGAFEAALCDDSPCYEFDQHAIEPTDLAHEITFNCTATRDGRVDGLAVWWRSYLTEDVVITTSPFELAEHSNWWIPLLRLDSASLPVHNGDQVSVKWRGDLEALNTWSWSVSVCPTDPAGAPPVSAGAEDAVMGEQANRYG